MKLYEIDRAILECIDTDTGEITDVERLAELNIAREEKLEGVALYIKNLLAEADSIKAEVDSLNKRMKSKKAEAERLKNYLSFALNGQAFETAKVDLRFIKSQSVEVTDQLEAVHWLQKYDLDDCLRYKMPEVEKAAVKKLLQEGKNIPGVVLQENQNLQLK